MSSSEDDEFTVSSPHEIQSSPEVSNYESEGETPKFSSEDSSGDSDSSSDGSKEPLPTSYENPFFLLNSSGTTSLVCIL